MPKAQTNDLYAHPEIHLPHSRLSQTLKDTIINVALNSAAKAMAPKMV